MKHLLFEVVFSGLERVRLPEVREVILGLLHSDARDVLSQFHANLWHQIWVKRKKRMETTTGGKEHIKEEQRRTGRFNGCASIQENEANLIKCTVTVLYEYCTTQGRPFIITSVTELTLYYSIPLFQPLVVIEPSTFFTHATLMLPKCGLVLRETEGQNMRGSNNFIDWLFHRYSGHPLKPHSFTSDASTRPRWLR